MKKTVCFDLTHLVSRLGIRHPSGIDKVDLAYARHFASDQSRFGPSVHYGLTRPHVLPSAATHEVLEAARSAHWDGEDYRRDQVYLRLHAQLTGRSQESDLADPLDGGAAKSRWQRTRDELSVHLLRSRLRLTSTGRGVPRNAVYLNAAQHLFEYHHFFKWMTARPDVTPVFVVHDLLPLDYPEYFPRGYKTRFQRRVETMFRHGRAFITTTNAVRERLLVEMESRGQPLVPIHVAPLPSSLNNSTSDDHTDAELETVPYFVTVGTIEPRKNHLMLLNIWRQLAEASDNSCSVPKLVIVGGRGWENEQVIDKLDRSMLIRPHVLEGAGLSTTGLIRLVANARALLMPSHAEGYGLPMVEALTLGTSVVATDAPEFQEVTQGCATYLDPLDGVGWTEVIRLLADRQSKAACAAQTRLKAFEPPMWDRYFDRLEGFLDCRKHSSSRRFCR